jgi:hypothetical protein
MKVRHFGAPTVKLPWRSGADNARVEKAGPAGSRSRACENPTATTVPRCDTRGVIEEIVVECPCCGEPAALDVDTTAGPEQSYFEDCPVCCRPMEVFVRSQPGEILSISVSAD